MEDNKRITRLETIQKVLTGVAGAALIPAVNIDLNAQTSLLKPRRASVIKTACDLAEVTGDDPYKCVIRAVELLGGISKFVKKGDIVVVKPNIGWNRAPEYAANTNPQAVAAMIKLARDAGAKKVKVFDNTCNSTKMCYLNSGIAEAVKKAGGEVIYPSSKSYQAASFPKGSAMDDWPINREAVECDCFINMPVAKHHSLTTLTLSIKNLMGVCGGSRGIMHWNIDKKLAELAAFIRPELTVIDAYRVLVRNGPSGGSLKDVELKKTFFASADPVLADCAGAALMGKNPSSIGHILQAAKMGLGSMNLAAANIKKAAL